MRRGAGFRPRWSRCAAGKLGAILVRFPPWFPISRARKDYIVACAQRAAPDRVCVEFRNRTWMTPGNQGQTLAFPGRAPPAVCVRGHAPRPPRLHPASTRRHLARPGRGPHARAPGQVGQQRYPRAVRLPLHRCRVDGVGAQGGRPWPATPGKPTGCSTTATATTPRSTPSSSPPCSSPDTHQAAPGFTKVNSSPAHISQPVAQSLICPIPRDGALCMPGVSRVCAGQNGAKHRPMNPSVSDLAI
jgi:Protein of unknown function DUF72